MGTVVRKTLRVAGAGLVWWTSSRALQDFKTSAGTASLHAPTNSQSFSRTQGGPSKYCLLSNRSSHSRCLLVLLPLPAVLLFIPPRLSQYTCLWSCTVDCITGEVGKKKKRKKHNTTHTTQHPPPRAAFKTHQFCELL